MSEHAAARVRAGNICSRAAAAALCEHLPPQLEARGDGRARDPPGGTGSVRDEEERPRGTAVSESAGKPSRTPAGAPCDAGAEVSWSGGAAGPLNDAKPLRGAGMGGGGEQGRILQL